MATVPEMRTFPAMGIGDLRTVLAWQFPLEAPKYMPSVPLYGVWSEYESALVLRKYVHNPSAGETATAWRLLGTSLSSPAA